MNLTQQELETIEKLAGLFYTPKQIAIILEIDPEMFEAHIRSETGNTYRAYYKGYYEADIELRKSITQSALSGSSPAQTMLRDIQKFARTLTV